MNKEDIIKQANSVVETTEFNSLKKDLIKNSDSDKTDSLALYNAMLDNITIGAHTSTTVEFAGIEWKLRLFTAEELLEIRIDIHEKQNSYKIFEKWFVDYWTILKVLSIALSPSPFKREDKSLFAIDDLRKINYEVLEYIYREYIHFVDMATRKPTEFTEDEATEILEHIKKKPELLKELDRGKLLLVANYHLDYSLRLEKMLGSDTTN